MRGGADSFYPHKLSQKFDPYCFKRFVLLVFAILHFFLSSFFLLALFDEQVSVYKGGWCIFSLSFGEVSSFECLGILYTAMCTYVDGDFRNTSNNDGDAVIFSSVNSGRWLLMGSGACSGYHVSIDVLVDVINSFRLSRRHAGVCANHCELKYESRCTIRTKMTSFGFGVAVCR